MNNIKILPARSSLISIALLIAWLSALFFTGVDYRLLLLTQFVFLLTYFYIFFNLPKSPISLTRNYLSLFLFLFWVWFLLSVNWSESPHISRHNVFILSLLPASFFVYQFAKINDAGWRNISLFLIFIACALSIHAIYQQYALGLSPSSVFINRNSLAALLNIIILLTCSRYLIAINSQKINLSTLLLAATILLMTFVSGLSKSRGASLSLLIALAILLFLAAKPSNRKHIMFLALVVPITLFISDIFSDAKLFSRLSSMTDIESSGANRFVIWQQAWEMIKDHPILGIGPGMFWLIYPQYRLASDSSGGYFVHNDYMQMWLESGLPGLLLFLLILITIGVSFIKFALNKPDRLTEAAGIFCAILAVSMHSLFTFNFFITAHIIITGLFIGRLNELLSNDNKVPISLHRAVKPIIYKIILSAAFLSLSLILFKMWQSNEYQRVANAFIEKNDYASAEQNLLKAESLHANDALLLTHANIIYTVLSSYPKSEIQSRKLLFNKALSLLVASENLNHYRSIIYELRAWLYAKNPDLGPANSADLAILNFKKCLSLDARQYRIRYAYALSLLRRDESEKALNILNAGIAEYYPHEGKHFVPYLELTLRQRFMHNDFNGAMEIAKMIHERVPNNTNLTAEDIYDAVSTVSLDNYKL
ncbi:O-antigen ligase family protein [Sulfuriflexus mobilis]|uniref:O-antigen ligase family protein n=1 Tax=Sulfuriflexus mobilis TaxID=1811807 RepID=UPI000F83DA97|nr:O-antigen ligase family protein [Sulfuriflexus mobilis]